MRLETHLNRAIAVAILSCSTSGCATITTLLTRGAASRQPRILSQVFGKSTCIEPPRRIVYIVRFSVGQLQDRVCLETRQMVVAPSARRFSVCFVVSVLRTVFGVDVFRGRRQRWQRIGRRQRLNGSLVTVCWMHAHRRTRSRRWH